ASPPHFSPPHSRFSVAGSNYGLCLYESFAFHGDLLATQDSCKIARHLCRGSLEEFLIGDDLLATQDSWGLLRFVPCKALERLFRQEATVTEVMSFVDLRPRAESRKQKARMLAEWKSYLEALAQILLASALWQNPHHSQCQIEGTCPPQPTIEWNSRAKQKPRINGGYRLT
ncbi:unnamed protein product, partial [Musa textilis]